MRAFRQDIRGAALIEFAIVAPVMLLFIFGGLDAGHSLYVKSVLDGEMQKAARDTSLEDASSAVRRDVIQERVRASVQKVMGGANVTFQLTSFHDYRTAQRGAEEFTDSNHDSLCNNGDAYVDSNNNGQWDSQAGVSGSGGSKDVVLMTALVAYPRMLISRFVLGDGDVTLTSSTLLRNQPSSDQAAAPLRNCP